MRLLVNFLTGPEPLPYKKRLELHILFLTTTTIKKKVKNKNIGTNHKRKKILEVYLFSMLTAASVHFLLFLIANSLKISILNICMSKVFFHQQTCNNHTEDKAALCSVLFKTLTLLHKSTSKGPGPKKLQLYILEFRTYLHKDQCWT